MPYTKQTWVDGDAGGTPVSATRLNAIETGIDTAHDTADAAIPATEKGAANGVATLGADGLVPGAQLPEAGVSDHGALTGLADDDHPLYALADGSRGSFLTSVVEEGFRVYKAASQALSASTHTVVVFDMVERDDGGDYNSTTGEWTCPESDWYDFSAFVYLQTPTAGDRHIINLRVNGADAARVNDAAATGSNSMVVGGATSLYVSAGQTVTVTAWRSAAGNVNGGQALCFFTGKRRYGA